jgi:hypothetical protein
MLTKGEVLHKMQGFECPKYLMESCWQPIYDQAVAAIDLAAENARLKAELAEYAETFSEQNNALSDNIIANARLKAKLDAVRAECEQSRQSGRRLSALQILDILDKDGDTDA